MRRRAKQLMASLVACLRRWVTGLLEVRREHWRCCSVLRTTEVILTQEFLPGAKLLRVELQTPWRLSWRWLMPRMRARVLDARRQPIELDMVCNQSSQNGILRFHLTFQTEVVADQAMFWIQLFTAEQVAILSEIAFTRLDRDQLLSELKVRCLEAYACIGSRRVVTQRLHSGVHQLGACVRLQLSNPEHRALFERVPAYVALTIAGLGQGAAWNTQLQFSGETFRWEVPLTEALPLFKQHAGNYQLALRCEEYTLARLPLSVRSEHDAYAEAVKEVEVQATLEHCRCEAINHRGQGGPLKVVAEDFRELRIEAVIGMRQTDMLFDEFLVPLGCEFWSRGVPTVISRQVLDLTLRSGANPFRLNLLLQPDRFRQATSDCVLELRLGKRLLASMPAEHKSRRQINDEKAARLLDSLSLSEVELTVEREGKVVETDDVFATDRWLKPRFTARAEGFDEDVPRLTWQLTIRFRHIATRRTFEQTHTLTIWKGTNRCHRLAVPVEHLRACLPPGRCTLSLHSASRPLAHRGFRFVAEDEILSYTQELVLRNLRVLDQQLACESRNHSYATQTVPFCAERLRVHFTVQSQGFNAALPEWNLPFHLKLVADRLAPAQVYQGTLTLSPRPATLDLPISLAGTPLADHPGHYKLQLHVKELEVARIHFCIVSEAEIIEQMEISVFEMTAVSHHGREPVRFSVLSLEHRELRIAFGVRAGFPAPGFALPGRLEVVSGQRVLFSSDFFLALDQETITQELKPLPVAALWAKGGERDQTLHVQISVGGTVKDGHPLKLQRRTRLTNFEGALRQDAHAIGDVDEEYREILQRLG